MHYIYLKFFTKSHSKDMIKNFLPVLCLLLTSQLLTAQSDVTIEFKHMAGNEELVLDNQYYMTSSGTEVKIDRLDYYISFPEFVLKNGETVKCKQDYYLISEGKSAKTITGAVDEPAEIEFLKFFVGVDSMHNHLDPSTYPSSHALAHQNPSMHWGWVSGYIFHAFEGTAINTLGVERGFVFHSIGNSLFTEVTVPVNPQEEGERSAVIDLHVDILRMIGTLDVHSVIAMGDDPRNHHIFNMMKDAEVFYDPNFSSSIANLSGSTISISPNPFSNQLQIHLNEIPGNTLRAQIIDLNGRTMQEFRLENSQSVIEINQDLQPGVYVLKLLDQTGVYSSSKIIKGR
jgi:hypothetical protein